MGAANIGKATTPGSLGEDASPALNNIGQGNSTKGENLQLA